MVGLAVLSGPPTRSDVQNGALGTDAPYRTGVQSIPSPWQ